jgi:hypothetical protein
MVPTIIEAMLGGLIAVAESSPFGVRGANPVGFHGRINEILLSTRISFELVDVELIEKESQELHSAVVAPVLRLLSGRAGWGTIENAYQGAFGGDP